MKFNLNKITNRKLLVISIFTFILCLAPYICSSGYLSDDVPNINVSGIKYFYSLFGFTVYIIKKWIKLGRFYPFAFYSIKGHKECRYFKDTSGFIHTYGASYGKPFVTFLGGV